MFGEGGLKHGGMPKYSYNWQLHENKIVFPASLKTESEINYLTPSTLELGAYSYAQLLFNNNINLNILQAHLKFIYRNIQNSSF